MRTLMAVTLFLVGLCVTLYGLGMAIAELVGLYQGALNDPLGAQDVGGAQAVEPAKVVGDRMWRSALIGMAGLPLLIIGSVMLSLSVWRRLRRALTQKG